MVSYGFYGARLDQVQRIQRLYNTQSDEWGFKDAAVLALAYAIMMGESGGYLKAFHHNVERTEDGMIKRIVQEDGKEYMRVKSTDLGFIQKNVVHNPAPLVGMNEADAKVFVDALFEENPKLANGYESCKIAWQMYQQRGFDPWYAFTNKSYQKSLGNACVAVGKWLANKYLDDPDYVIVNPKRI